MILEIRTPTRKILKNMVNEGWITTKTFESERIPLELLMMFQHGIIPMIENEQDYEINLFKNISIKGQIRKRKIGAIYETYFWSRSQKQSKNCG